MPTYRKMSTADNAEDLIARIQALSRPLEPLPTHHPTRMAPLVGVRAVVFDIYGTLLISGSGDVGTAGGHDAEQVLREALAATGFCVDGVPAQTRISALLEHTIRAAQEHRRGHGIEFPEVDILEVWATILRAVPGLGLSRDGISDARLRSLAIEYECRSNPVWPMPGGRELLVHLRTTGKHLGIVSNAQFYTPLVIHALFDASPAELGFDPRLCAWSYQNLEAKPSKRLFQQVLDEFAHRYAIMAGQILYVGNDCLNDIWPAARLGCKTALYAGDARSLRLRENDARCIDLQPDAVIDHLEQLARI